MHSYFLIENPEVLILDAIYKINRFRMPLVNIIKMIKINRNFYAASVFFTGEKENDYNMIFLNLKDLYDFWKLLYPLIFVTDACEAEIKVLKKIFPEVNHIFCIFHINNNILVKLKFKIKAEYNRENGLNSDNKENST